MAQKVVASRMEGDDYQSRFFWYYATQLLIPNSHVKQVSIEHDAALAVDDIAVFYFSPGRRDKELFSEADFFQVKYHVDQRDYYSFAHLIDPSFLGSRSRNSFLQRLFDSFLNIRNDYNWFTLNLVSNWVWRDDDFFVKSIRDSGALPEKFFTSTEGSKLGETRQNCIDHLQTDVETFKDFAKRLRFKLNYFCNADLGEVLNTRLQLVGLKSISANQMHSPYDDLARKFIQKGLTEFDKQALLDCCSKEGLLLETPIPRQIKSIGIRSFIPFAENIENETDSFVCVSSEFDGRYPISDKSWQIARDKIESYIKSHHKEFTEDHRLVLDCHSSFAVFAGFLLTKRAAVFPTGPRPKLVLFKPNEENLIEEDLWVQKSFIINRKRSDLAIALSVTHQIDQQVRDYIDQNSINVGKLLVFKPKTGVGVSNIKNAEVAWSLANQFVQIVRANGNHTAQKLLFIAGPNFFSFFIGQQCKALGSVTLYEYDFDGEKSYSYFESITIP